MLNIDEKAPHFCLPNQDEIQICLRDFIGKWVVLYFYPKDNTPGCTTEACDFSENLHAFSNLDAIVIGVSPDSPKKHKAFIEKQSLKIILLADEEKEVAKEYGVWQLKKNYGKEYMGIVRSTFLINPEGKIAKIWTKVKVNGHVVEVKKTLEEFLNK